MIPLEARPRLHQSRLRRRGDDVLLVASERGLVLRGAAAEILALVDGDRSVADIVSALASAHGEAEPDTIRRDVLAFLDELNRRRLLSIPPADGADDGADERVDAADERVDAADGAGERAARTP